MRRAALAAMFAYSLTGLAEAASFDGIWSVNIITQTGSCDQGYRYRIRVVGGALQYAPADGGGGGFTVTGHVTPSGMVTVTIARGDQRATGSGKLVGDRGSGTWTGGTGGGACAGRWVAEKRA